jgi:hypothetical protein
MRGMDWIDMAQVRQGKAVVIVVMNLWFPQNVEKFLTT